MGSERPLMDQPKKEETVSAQSKPQPPLDVEHCTPAELRATILDIRTPADVLDRIAQAYCHDEEILRELVRCPNLDETTLAFIALAASEEIRSFISVTRCVDVVAGEGADEDKQRDG